MGASRARGFKSAAWTPAERRDLIGSARALRSRGFIPVIAEIKPKAIGRHLSPEEVELLPEPTLITMPAPYPC